jgi:hypothetical protein
MLSPKRPASSIERPVAKQNKCGACCLFGHNCRKCPAVPTAAAAPAAAPAVDGPNYEDGRFAFGLHTLQIAQKGIHNDKTGAGVPTAYNLQTLFQFLSRSLPSTSHCAMADVKATATVF